MQQPERQIPSTFVVDKTKAHEQAFKVDVIYKALLDRREQWYRQRGPGKYREITIPLPEISSRRMNWYLRKAEKLEEAAKDPTAFLNKLIERGLSQRTIARWQRDLDLTGRVFQEEFGGVGFAEAGGKTGAETGAATREDDEYMSLPEELKTAPTERPAIAAEPGTAAEAVEAAPLTAPTEPAAVVEEKVDIRSELSSRWEALRSRFRQRKDLQLRNRVAGLLTELQKRMPHLEWSHLSTTAKEKIGRLAAKARPGERLTTAVESLGGLVEWGLDAGIDGMEWLVEKAEAGRKRIRTIRVLPTRESLSDWLTEAKGKFPAVGRVVKLEELRTRWEKINPNTRNFLIGTAIGATIGVSAVVVELTVRKGKDFQLLATHLSGLLQKGREIAVSWPTPGMPFISETATQVIPTATEVATQVAPTISPTVTEALKATPTPLSAPDLEVILKGIKLPRETTQVLPKLREAGVSALTQIKEAAAEKAAQATRLAAEAVRLEKEAKALEGVQAMVRLMKEGLPVTDTIWQTSGKMAEQIFSSAGVQADPERLTIVTDAIKDALKQTMPSRLLPGTKVTLNAKYVTEALLRTIEQSRSVLASGGKLKVAADQADFEALRQVAEYLRGLI